MQTVSETYARLLRQTGTIKQHKAVINGLVYDASRLVGAPRTSNSLFGDVAGPQIGQANAGQVTLTIRPRDEAIPRTAKIELFTRLADMDHLSGTLREASEWIPKGVFYIDTRRADAKTGTLTIHGFDAMLKASPNYIDTEEESGLWPRKARVVVEDIAYRMGVELDEQTVLQDYDVGFMPLTSGREILRWIAAMHGGNWVITDAGKLRLVPLVAAGDGVDLGTDMEEFETAPEFAPFTGVQFYYEDKDTVFAGNDEGRVLQAECPWATQEIADAVLENIRGYVYRPYEATRAVLDPAVEVGDPVLVNGTDSVLASCNTTFNALMVSDISAPNDEEIDHEYPYQDPNRNRTRREIAKAKADIQIGVDQINAIVAGINGELSKLELAVGSIELAVSDPSADGHVSLQLIVGGVTQSLGLIKMDGSVDISGSLSAGELYSALGDIAQLTVDSLSTSRKIPRYLARDTSDINYIDIRDRRLALVRAFTDGTAVQATNPNGQLLFWETDITDATIGDDGYPYIAGTRVFAKPNVTDYPVMIYKYTEWDRWLQTFDAGNNFGPQQVWGFGDGTSSGLGRGYLEKLGLSFDIYNLGSDGVKRGMFMGDKFVDIFGLRQTTELDLSGYDRGVIIETVDGGIVNRLDITFDDEGDPTIITDNAGHARRLKW